ncbi:MAG: hypothetical protein P8X79_20300 [Reinekea sp.]
MISICFSKIVGAPIGSLKLGSLKFLGSKEESMACALRRYGVTDSGSYNLTWRAVRHRLFPDSPQLMISQFKPASLSTSSEPAV